VSCRAWRIDAAACARALWPSAGGGARLWRRRRRHVRPARPRARVLWVCWEPGRQQRMPSCVRRACSRVGAACAAGRRCDARAPPLLCCPAAVHGSVCCCAAACAGCAAALAFVRTFPSLSLCVSVCACALERSWSGQHCNTMPACTDALCAAALALQHMPVACGTRCCQSVRAFSLSAAR
jgi:hypothetical protein